LMDCIWWKTTESVFTAIFQNEFDRFTQTHAGFVFGFSLAIRSRNLRAIGNEPMTILLNDCREFVCHDLPLFIPVSLTQEMEKQTCGGPANIQPQLNRENAAVFFGLSTPQSTSANLFALYR